MRFVIRCWNEWDSRLETGTELAVTFRADEPMSRHSPYRVGGNCTAWVQVHDRKDLPKLLAIWSKQKASFVMFGHGTHTIFRDGALQVMVCRLGIEFTQTARVESHVELGAAIPIDIARHRLQSLGLDALHHAYGGTLGGWIGRLTPEDIQKKWPTVVALEVATGRGYKWVETHGLKRIPKVVTSIRIGPVEQLEKAPKRFTLSSTSAAWFSGPGTIDQKREMIRRIAMDGARLRGVMMPKEYPEDLVCLGQGTAQDYWELHRSVLDRVKRFHGVTWRCGLKWQGRK